MITHAHAQAIQLAALGLHRRPSTPATKTEVLETIQRMGVLQIDTISVVARSPYLVLWSRLGNYESVWLDELLAEGHLFEGWAHAACFLPKEDYPLLRRLMLAEDYAPRSRAWLADHPEVVQQVLVVLHERGEVKSAHFDRPKEQPGGWWNWKTEKVALESLFNVGELMIARREKFQRVYALRETVLPQWSDADAPPLETVYRELVLQTVRALGISPAAWLADYYRLPKILTLNTLKTLVAEGLVEPVTVEGWTETAYIHPDNLPLLTTPPEPTLTTLLSPFDPLVWDRQRVAAMFGFDYRIECYTPAPKRVYGYFTLPILSQGRLVGRLDAKAHRAEHRFEVKALYLEAGVVGTEDLAADMMAAIRECAEWHRTPTIEVGRCEPPEFKAVLLQHLSE